MAGFGEVRGRVYELSLDLGEESALIGIADTNVAVYDGQEFVVVQQMASNGSSTVVLNAKQIAALAAITGKKMGAVADVLGGIGDVDSFNRAVADEIARLKKPGEA